MNEFDIIARFFAPLAKHKGALGLKDDAALLRVPVSQELVITTDTLVEKVHFIGDEPPALLAQKLLRVNCSDMAAMGAKPFGYFLNLSVPATTDENWFQSFANGLRIDQKTFACSLLGGDTTSTHGALTLSATMPGLVPRGKALRRNGAKPGDDIYVTGTIGDAALGLKVIKGQLAADKKALEYLLNRYRLPSPRLALAQKLRALATACMDISDGLMQDLDHICNASKTGAEIYWESIPLSKAAQSVVFPAFQETILAGGDDYELLFTAPSHAAKQLAKAAGMTNIPITRIGQVTAGKSSRIVDKDGHEIFLPRKGYMHF